MMSYPTECRIGSVLFSPPWTNASGFLATPPATRRFSTYRTGGSTTKTLQSKEEKGHESPVFVEDPETLDCYNAIGLSGQGIYNFVPEMRLYSLPEDKVLNVSITSKESLDDFRRVAAHAITLADMFELMLELNYGCPNVERGMIIGQNPKFAGEYTAAIKALAGDIPIAAKLTPNVEDSTFLDVARACADAGADAEVMINTILSIYINPYTKQPHLTFKKGGGKSGQNIFEEGLRRVDAVSNMRDRDGYSFVIGAVGGVNCSDRAKRYFDAGADFLQFGTDAFLDRPMEKKREGVETVQEFLARMDKEIYETAA